MLGVLLESRAVRAQRGRGGAVSLVAHVGLVGVAVLATARGHVVAAAPPKVDVVPVQIAPPRPAPVSAPPASVQSPSTAPVIPITIPRLPSIDLPAVVPVALPEVRFDAAMTADDQRFARGDDGPHGDLGGSLPGNGTGGGGGLETMWSGSELSMRLLAKPIPPRYPEALRRTGVAGRVVVRFTVDTTGRVDMASVEVLESTHDLFTSAVRATLPGLRFEPASVGNHKTTAQAMMPFLFQINPD